MKNFLFLGLLCIEAATLHAGTLEVIPVDIHERLYPDRWPESKANAIHVPRGAPVTLQFALRSKKPGTATLGVRGELTGKARVHWLQSVHVEGNTQGSLKSVPAGPVPKGWFNHLVRKAPYDTLEALVEEDRMPVKADSTHGVVIEIPVSRDAKPGRYQGELLVSLASEQSAVPFSFEVHPTSLPERQPLESVHWMWAQPENLSNGEVPEWWSERHWQLLEQAGRQLRRFGDDTMYTPLINGEDALIQVRLRKDGSYHFDYSRFDRWAELFFGLGFRQLAGKHIIHIGPKVHIFDESTGTKRALLKDPKDREAWLAFIPFFYDSLHAHLKQKGWIERYIQHQYDEPSDAALYKRLTGLARKHLPGVRTADALNNRATRFTPLTDIAVFSLLQLNKHQKTAQQRRKQGKEVWLYHCTSPYPPHPNRHIDSHLTESRLFPWLAHKLGAQGFLFWAANGYRKADEYETSLGPFPSFAAGGKRYPAHPPGDNWFYYRSEDGLRPSIRIIAHREGLIDHALLSELAKRDANKAHELVKRIAPSISRYERDPAAYHRARAAILEALDHHGAETRNAAARQTKSAFIDWRDADRSCYGKVDDSGPGKHFNDNAQIVVADDGTWICAWSTGTHEAGAGMHLVHSLSYDKGRTWTESKPIEPPSKNSTAAYGYLFKSPANGRIFSIYRFHDHKKILSEMRAAGQKPSRVGGHFWDTTGEIAFRYSDDHGKTWSDRHIIPTRRTLVDNDEGPMSGWFFGMGPVVIDNHVWFSGNKFRNGTNHNSTKASENTWETWFWKSPNMHTEKDPEKFIWENKPNGDRGIVPDEGVRYWVEASLVALENPKNLYCVARNRYAGVLGQSFSTDGGNTWQTPPSAAQYWDGSGDLNNPKAGPMLKQLSDGTYLLTFYNDRARSDNKVPWHKLFDRSPLWVAVGWPDGNVLKFSQPEILLYNDENVKTSAEGNRSSIYHPFLFETDGEVFTVFSNKKTDVQIAKIPQSLIDGLKHQRSAKLVAKEGLIADLSAEQIAASPAQDIPDSAPWFDNSSAGTGFALDFWLEPGKMQPGETLLDTRNKEGQGIWVGITEGGKVGIELKDQNNKHEKAFSAEAAILADQLNHAVINVDEASHVITLIINGVISGDDPRMNFKQYDRDFGSIQGSQKLFLGTPSDEMKDTSKASFTGKIENLRIYNRYLRTSEAIANYRAGAQSVNFYISPNGSDANSGISQGDPFKTFKKTLEAVAAVPRPWSSDVVVHVMPGDYFLKSTINLTARHSGDGKYKLVMRNHGKLDSAVLIGGQKLDPSGWKKHKDGIIYQDLPEVERIDILYENRRKARKARFPNFQHLKDFPITDGRYFISGTVGKTEPWITAKQEDLSRDHLAALNLDIQNQIENYLVIWPQANRDWHKHVFRISHADPDSNRIYVSKGSSFIKNSDNDSCRYYIEGGLRLLDTKGEFYFEPHQHRLYYYPMQTGREVIYSTMNNIIKLNGARNISFDGLQFACSGVLPITKRAYTWTDGDAALSIHKSSAIEIRNCHFKSTGQSAINFEQTHNSTIENCLMQYMGQSGIKLYRSNNNTIRNCRIHDIGLRRVYCEGLALHCSKNNHVSQLEIFNSARYGITVRGRVGPNGLDNSPATNNRVEYIKMYDLNQDSGDTAGLHMAKINTPKGKEYVNFFNQITITRSIAQPNITDEWAPTGVYLDHPKSVMNQSMSNIEVKDYDPRYKGYTVKRFKGMYGKEDRTSAKQRQIMQNRPWNNDSSTKFNCSWQENFDPKHMEYSKIGLTENFPSVFLGNDSAEPIDSESKSKADSNP